MRASNSTASRVACAMRSSQCFRGRAAAAAAASRRVPLSSSHDGSRGRPPSRRLGGTTTITMASHGQPRDDDDDDDDDDCGQRNDHNFHPRSSLACTVHGVGNQVGKMTRTLRCCDGHSLTLATLPPSHSIHRVSSLSLPFSLSFSLSFHVSARLESTCHAVSSNFARHRFQAAQAASRTRRGSSTVARTCHATVARAFLAQASNFVMRVRDRGRRTV